ncbi:MAG: copper-translocating P-type ATPase [Lentimicrobium sp.]|nr:copper-translocating P-type ATPase [Lentimicrobium sp.]
MKPFEIDITLPVSGMSCAACAISAESMLKAQQGVKSATVNYASKSVRLIYQPDVVGLDELQRNLSSIGYDLIADPVDKLATFERMELAKLNLLRRKLIIAALFSFPIFVLSMLVHHPPLWMQFLFLALSIPVIFYSGISFYTTAWNLALRKQTSMDTLVALGTGAALAISLANTVFPNYFTANGLSSHVYYESAVVIITLILLGRFLEDRSRNKASAAIKSLMNLQPETVTRISGGKEETIALKNINAGDIILVKPGNTIPVDGIVIEGSSWVEESMMSGEPLPVFKQAGDGVLAGTGNQKGALTINTLKTGSQTVLSRIIAMVEEAQSSKAPVQKLVDRISAIFVPVVIIIALLTFITWFFVGPEPSITYAIVTSISVLVIACPCALGLATPTALIVAIGRGASQGILFRNASGLETAGKTDVLVIDKTGTLTTGKPGVEKIINFDNNQQNLIVFAGLSRISDHPLSSAVSKYLSENGIEAAKIDDFSDIPGKGISGWYDQQKYLAGSLSLLESEGVIINETDRQVIKKMEEEAYSITLLATPEKLLAAAAISDKVRESSASAVAALKLMKIKVIMLTGDHRASAKQIAAQTGIEAFESGLSPEDKAIRIRNLQAAGHKVAMAGDGINDTIALAAADTGVAMGSGSDASIGIAAITITGSSLHQIVEVIRLSRKTNRIIRQNLFWAFFYNVLMLPLAAGLFFSFTHQLLNPMIASASMAMSSVSVVMNSLRIRNS